MDEGGVELVALDVDEGVDRHRALFGHDELCRQLDPLLAVGGGPEVQDLARAFHLVDLRRQISGIRPRAHGPVDVVGDGEKPFLYAAEVAGGRRAHDGVRLAVHHHRLLQLDNNRLLILT